MNLLDIVIILIFLVFIFSGINRGFISSVLELGGLILSVAISLIYYIPFSSVLEEWGISQVFSGAASFLIIWAITLGIFNIIAMTFYRLIPGLIRESLINKILGVIPGFLKGLIIATLIVSLLVSIPAVPIFTSREAEESKLGKQFLEFSTVIISIGANIFGEPLKDAFGFFTIDTMDEDHVELNFTVDELEVDPAAEEEMLELLNRERSERGLDELSMNESVREVARKHSTDMFQKGYFSHVDLDGVTPFDRLKEGGVTYVYAGENLAAAPSVSMAHNGLMNSPGHKENILNPNFGQVGIGAIKSERHGIMFTQKFID